EGLNIGAVARVVPIKDIKTLLRAFKLVSEDYPEAKLYIMGPTQEDKPYYEECLQLVRTLEMTNSVGFTDRVDVKAWLPKMDLLV
ncbi:MAG: glycosyltransferase, partial [Candidatus Margulisiibacteriota bacterium]